VASLLAVRLFDEWFSFLPAGSLEPLRRDLDLTYVQLSSLLILMTAGGLVGGLFAIAADRVSRRAQASLGALGYGVSLACWGLGEHAWILGLGAFLLGLSSDALLSACEVALVDLAGDDLAGVLALGNLGAEIGDLLGPLLLAAAAGLGWSWRAPFIFGAVAFVAYAAVLATQPLPRPRPDPDRGSPASDVRACLRDRRVWRLSVISLLFDTMDEPFLGFAIAFLEVERGQSHSVAVLVGGSVLVGGMLGAAALTLGFGTRTGRTGPSVWAATTLAVSVLGIILAPTIPLQIAFGVLSGTASVTFWTRLQASILGLRPGQPGTTSAVVGYLSLPGALCPVAAAAAADRFGLHAALGVYLLVAVALTVVTAAGPRMTPPQRESVVTGSSATLPSTMR
jgi:hypothetical protein